MSKNICKITLDTIILTEDIFESNEQQELFEEASTPDKLIFLKDYLIEEHNIKFKIELL